MFWGLVLEPGKKYTQTVEQSFHISMAAVEPTTATNDVNSVVVSYEDEEYFLCSLSKNVLQQTLDLNFMEGTSVSFHTVGGKAKIHLTGYVLPDENDEDGFGDFEEGEEEMMDESADEMGAEEGEEEEGEEEEEEEAPVKPGKRKLEDKKKPKVEEPVVVESPAKKAKKDKKKQQKEGAAGQQEAGAKAEKTNGSPAAQKPAAATPSPKKRKLAGGLVVEDVKEGNGNEAKKGKNVSVYYTGRLQSNNKEFDKTVKGPGFKFRLGAGEVIKGWDLGVEGMKVGGKRKLTIPAHLAYGPKGAPPAIPPNSTLVFDVELKAVH